MAKTVQDFYKATITQDWSIGTGNFYVSVKPTVSEGWLYISPNNAAVREKIYYNGTGTDGNGDYITITQRGVGATDEQTHTIGEPVRMNVGEDFIKYMTDSIDAIVAAGTPDADTSTAGKVEIATDAEVIAGTNIGATGASLVATPGQIKTAISKQATTQTFTSNGTWTKPTGIKYVKVEAWGGGGGGGGRSTTNDGAGGGGGGYNFATILAADLGTTETVTIGAGGAGSRTGRGSSGDNSTFGSLLTAYGGSGGHNYFNEPSGGGGGGQLSKGGDTANDGEGYSGGAPDGGVTGTTKIDSYGGGGCGMGMPANIAGSSYYGGGGGGNNGSFNGGNSYYGGGGGGGSTGTGGTSVKGGNGGAGQSNGVVPGGGGGGNSTTSVGNGAAGKVIVTTFF